MDMLSCASDTVQRFAVLHFLSRWILSIPYLLAPGVPTTLHYPTRSKASRAGLCWGWGLAFTFCFMVTLIWSLLIGRAFGTDQTRLYFLHDSTNLIEYFFLCPAYVGLSVHFVVLLAANWARLSHPRGMVNTKALRLPNASAGIGVCLILLISSLVTVSFIRGALDPMVSPKVGWWVDHVAPDNSRVLSSLGIYYALLNFTLLAICVTAALAFLSFFLLCVRFGRMIAQQSVRNSISFAAVREMLSDFNEAYVTLKLLSAVLVLNLHTWKWAVEKETIVFLVLKAVLLIFGVVLISIPRYYIELEWYSFRERRASAHNAETSQDSDDVRGSAWVRGVTKAVDGLILTNIGFGFLHRFW